MRFADEGGTVRSSRPSPPSNADGSHPEHSGFWARHRAEKEREKAEKERERAEKEREAEKARQCAERAAVQRRYEVATAAWKQRIQELQQYLELIGTFAGSTVAGGLQLKSGERIFYRVAGARLVESRVQGGHWESVSVGYGYRRSRGHRVPGTPVPTEIDVGTMTVTNQRVVFAGATQTRECLYAKLLGAQHEQGQVTLSASNRQRAITLRYGSANETAFTHLFVLAHAHFQGSVPELRANIAALLAQTKAQPPQPLR